MQVLIFILTAVACATFAEVRASTPQENAEAPAWPGLTDPAESVRAQPNGHLLEHADQQDTLWQGCSYRGIELHGKVQIVDAFPDIKVQVVEAFPDVRVKWVTAFPDACGEWLEVDAFPDFKIQLVDAFPDVKIQEVDAFPGLTRGG